MKLDKTAVNREFFAYVGVLHRPFYHVLRKVKGLVSFGGVLGVLLVGVVEKLGGHPPGADLSHRNFLRLKLEGEGIAVMLNKGLC